jgi:serine protease Do
VKSRAPSEILTQFSDSLQQLASKVSPAVVQIEVTGFGTAEGHDREGSNTAVMVSQRAIGAGVIVDPDGYVMTNAHVVAGAQQIRLILPAVPATFFDISSIGKSQVLNAKLIGTQKDCDLALLKVEATNLPTLPFNLDHSPQLGELVFAVGSPEGLQSSVTMGVVSSAFRQPDPNNPMVYLQTDAPINPGNSGGPLVEHVHPEQQRRQPGVGFCHSRADREFRLPEPQEVRPRAPYRNWRIRTNHHTHNGRRLGARAELGRCACRRRT